MMGFSEAHGGDGGLLMECRGGVAAVETRKVNEDVKSIEEEREQEVEEEDG